MDAVNSISIGTICFHMLVHNIRYRITRKTVVPILMIQTSCKNVTNRAVLSSHHNIIVKAHKNSLKHLDVVELVKLNALQATSAKQGQ